MKFKLISALALFLSVGALNLFGQRKGLESINEHDLRMHMKFLASDELEGRNTGEPGLLIAARYLAGQAEQLGLQEADAETGYFQYYTIVEKANDVANSGITISRAGKEEEVNRDPFFMMSALEGEHISLEGELVFAGYGINDEENSYNDLKGIDLADKFVLIMNGAPKNEDGSEYLFGEKKYTGMRAMQYKMEALFAQQAKAVLIVQDPKSGFASIEEEMPGIANYLGRSRSLEGEESSRRRMSGNANIVFVNRSVADQLLAYSGKDLKDLQLGIDSKLSPNSFALDSLEVKIDLKKEVKNVVVSNVFGLIEGSDPELKDEVVIYVAHYDHVGTDGKGGVFNGADDNASGTVALIEIAEAFMKEKKRPARSIGILWVSAEEIGLYGSKYFADHPMVNEEQIAAVINLDMVGRTRTPEDGQSDRPGLTIAGGDTVKVIGGLQSEVLMDISKLTLDEMDLIGNYDFNDLSHPERYFYRSDHINFARKDIPVLFYSTGTHRDYHKITDEEKLIDYDKFLKMTRFSYKAGFNVADYKDDIEVDNPMSAW